MWHDPGDRAAVVCADRPHKRLRLLRARVARRQPESRVGRNDIESVNGLGAVDVCLRRAESRGESGTCVYFVRGLSDKLTSHVRCQNERSHPGGRHQGVPYFDRAERVGLSAQVRQGNTRSCCRPRVCVDHILLPGDPPYRPVLRGLPARITVADTLRRFVTPDTPGHKTPPNSHFLNPLFNGPQATGRLLKIITSLPQY